MVTRIFSKRTMLVIFLCALLFGLGTQAFAKLPVVGISTGSSGTSWRTIMIAALEEVGNEYKESGRENRGLQDCEQHCKRRCYRASEHYP